MVVPETQGHARGVQAADEEGRRSLLDRRACRRQRMTYWTDQGCTICCYLALERHWKLPSCEAGRQRGAGARGRSQETRHLALSPISEPCYVFSL